MSRATLSVIIPTLGRPSLSRTLDSLFHQLRDGDEVIVVADTGGDSWSASRRTTAAMKKILKPRVWVRFAEGPSNGRIDGSPQRTFGMRLAAMADAKARTSHICFLDDDDVYTEDALEKFREYATDVPCIFRMEYGDTGVSLWSTPEIAFGNVGTPMFLVPNVRMKLGEWEPKTELGGTLRGDDYNFIKETVDKMGGVEWVDHVVALINPTSP